METNAPGKYNTGDHDRAEWCGVRLRNLIMAAEVYQGNQADVPTLEDSVNAAQTNQAATGSEVVIQEVVDYKGYHSGGTLETIAIETPYRTYIPEPRRKKKDRRRGPGSGAGGDEARAKGKAVLLPVANTHRTTR